MIGKYDVEIYNNRMHFHLEVKRNITVIQGDSATGKSQMIQLLSDYLNDRESSGVTVICDCPCSVFTNADWRAKRQIPTGTILFIDEDFEAMHSKEFAQAIRKTDTYFVLVTRDSLYELAYSIEEIYGMRTTRRSQKYVDARKVYNELYHLYHSSSGTFLESQPQRVITEDSNAGHEFFQYLYPDICASAQGKSNVLHCLNPGHSVSI